MDVELVLAPRASPRRRVYELWSQQEVVGRLVRSRWPGRETRARSLGERFVIRCPWRGPITMTRMGEGAVFARVRGRRPRRIELTDGRVLVWRRLSWWRSEWTMSGLGSPPWTLRFTVRGGLRRRAALVVRAHTSGAADLVPLALLGCALVLEEQSATTAAATAAISAGG